MPPPSPHKVVIRLTEDDVLDPSFLTEQNAQALADGFEASGIQLPAGAVDLSSKANLVDGKVPAGELPDFGTAAFQNVGVFATAAQGAKADTALQNASAFATAAQGAKADTALQNAAAFEPAGAAAAAVGTHAGLTNGLAHSMAAINGLIDALAGKQPAGNYLSATGDGSGLSGVLKDASVFATAAQGAKADTALQNASAFDVAGAASSAISAHESLTNGLAHGLSAINGLTEALAGKAASSHTHAVSDLSDATPNSRSLIQAANYAAMRGLLGLATTDSPTFGGLTANGQITGNSDIAIYKSGTTGDRGLLFFTAFSKYRLSVLGPVVCGIGSGDVGNGQGAWLRGEANNILALRNDTDAAQTFRLYGSYTDSSNYRRLYLSSTTAGAFTLGVEGAGTGASGNTLTVYATSLTDGSQAEFIPSGNFARIRSNGGRLYIQGPNEALTGGSSFISGGAALPLTFATGNTGKAFLSQEGDFSVGLSVATARLSLANGTSAAGLDFYNTRTDASNYERGFMRWSSNVLEVGAEAAGTGTARNLRLYGNVGIGRADPPEKLSVYGTVDGGVSVEVKNATAGASSFSRFIARSDAGSMNFFALASTYTTSNQYIASSGLFEGGGMTNGLGFSTTVDAPIRFWQAGAEKMRINTGGNVGIGTTAPTALLTLEKGTTATDFHLYNTKTDASNYERGFLRWSSNVLEIGAEAAGTGTARNLKLSAPITLISANAKVATRLRVGYDAATTISDGNFGAIQLLSAQNNAACFSITQDYVATGHFGFASTSNVFVLGSDGAAISFRQNPTASLAAGTERAKINLSTGDIETLTAGAGIILKSPDGTRYKATIANGGTWTIAAA